MKLLVEVKESKAEFVMELLGSFPFVKAEEVREPRKAGKVRKARPLSARKKEVIEGIRTAVKELKLVKAGKLKTRTLQEFLDDI